MDYPTIIGIVVLAALIHASFQVSVSMVTLLSGHAIGRKERASRTLRLVGSFLLGTVVMTALAISFVAFTVSQLARHTISPVAWSVVSGLTIGLGIAVWAFYYRRGQSGTSLWLPRGIARFLTERTSATHYSAESFSLGLVSVIAEGLFIVGPVTAAAFAIVHLPAPLQLAGIALYTTIASTSILLVTVLIGSGRSLSRIQKWREANRWFLQFAAGSALVVLGFFIYVNEVVTEAVISYGGF
ncbi:MAG TPA: hypothetical protein PKV96_03950 [Candidatus Saccharimonas sp.]|jgi:hypothetical protein|nr:hypothetical protein [Candidatus Saccharimonas sp.]